MLNPDQIGRLRKLVASGAVSHSFEGFRIGRIDLDIAYKDQTIGTVASEPGESVLMKAPDKIFGSPYNPTCLNGVATYVAKTQEKKLFLLKNVSIIGNYSIVGDFGIASAELITRGDSLNAFIEENNRSLQGFVFVPDNGQGHSSCYCVLPERQLSIGGKGMFFNDREPNNYGSFLFRILPQILMASDLKLYNFDYYVVGARSPWIREAIVSVGLPDLPIFTVPEIIGERLEQLYHFNNFDNEGLFDASTLSRVRRVVDRYRTSRRTSAERPVKLYIPRDLSAGHRPNYRRLLNEPDVQSMVEKREFAKIYPETLSFLDQLRLFSQATRIVGPSGSGMLNAIFSDAGAKVLDMESFTHTVRQHAKIYSGSGKNYSFLFGSIPNPAPNPIFANWTVELDDVRQALDWIA